MIQQTVKNFREINLIIHNLFLFQLLIQSSWAIELNQFSTSYVTIFDGSSFHHLRAFRTTWEYFFPELKLKKNPSLVKIEGFVETCYVGQFEITNARYKDRINRIEPQSLYFTSGEIKWRKMKKKVKVFSTSSMISSIIRPKNFLFALKCSWNLEGLALI